MILWRLLLAAGLLLAGSLPVHAEDRSLAHLWGFRRTAIRYGFKAALDNALWFGSALVGPLTWLPLALLHVLTGFPSGGPVRHAGH